MVGERSLLFFESAQYLVSCWCMMAKIPNVRMGSSARACTRRYGVLSIVGHYRYSTVAHYGSARALPYKVHDFAVRCFNDERLKMNVSLSSVAGQRIQGSPLSRERTPNTKHQQIVSNSKNSAARPADLYRYFPRPRGFWNCTCRSDTERAARSQASLQPGQNS